MRGYRVEFEPRAWSEIMALPEKLQSRIFAATDRLKTDPRPPGAEKMKGEEYSYSAERVIGYIFE